MSKFDRLLANLDRFFFGQVSLLPLAAFRVIFSFNLLIMYLVRLLDWRFYFTDAGFVPASGAIDILPEIFRPSFALFPSSPGMALAINVILIAALLGLFLGIQTRVMAIIAFVAHLSLLQRNYAIAYGADIVSTFYLLGLCFMESDRYLSLRCWFMRRHPDQTRPISDLFSTVGMRLVQVQLCLIYGYTGMEKLKGQTWWDGTAVWSVLGNRQIMMVDTSWLRNAPLVIVAMTFITVLWEIYFPALIWVKPIRKWVLLLGVALHGGIALTVGLVFFSSAMVSTYLVFLDPLWLRNFLARFLPMSLLPA